MPAFVALFRAINVGGRSTVTMADLRTMASGLGLGKPRTILQTGNLVFSTNAADPRELETRIEAAALAVLGLEARVFVRSPAKWDALVAALPFPDFAREHPSHLLAMPLQDEPSQTAEAALRAAGFQPIAPVLARLRLDFASWTARIGTPDVQVRAIRALQQQMPGEIAERFAIETDGSFKLDTIYIQADASAGAP